MFFLHDCFYSVEVNGYRRTGYQPLIFMLTYSCNSWLEPSLLSQMSISKNNKQNRFNSNQAVWILCAGQHYIYSRIAKYADFQKRLVIKWSNADVM